MENMRKACPCNLCPLSDIICVGQDNPTEKLKLDEAKKMFKEGFELVLELKLEKAVQVYSKAILDLRWKYGSISKMPAEIQKLVNDVDERLPLYNRAIARLAGLQLGTAPPSTFNPVIVSSRASAPTPRMPLTQSTFTLPSTTLITRAIKCDNCGIYSFVDNLAYLGIRGFRQCNYCNFLQEVPSQPAPGPVYFQPSNNNSSTAGRSNKRQRDYSGGADSNFI